MGRQTTFNEKDAAEIIERLSTGTPLAVICRDDHLPTDRTVRNWVSSHKEFASAIAGARESGFDMLAAECLEIAEDGSHDYAFKRRADGTEYEDFDSEHYQRSKLRIETRLKLLAKWDPKRYGDKMALTGGNEDDAPLRFEAVSHRDRAKGVAALVAKQAKTPK